MPWSGDAGLRVRMAATLATLAVVATLGAVTVYAAALALLWIAAVPGAFEPAGTVIAAGLARPLAAAGAVLFVVAVGSLEVRLDGGLGLPSVDARRASRRGYPRLTAAVDRLVQQFECDRPTVAVTTDPAPLAMTSGLRSSSATLVVSTGLIDLLDDDELEAVVAHELAHVANGDAAIVTAAAMPMVLADAVRDWAVADGDLQPGDAYADAGGEVNPLVYPVAAGFWFVGRALVAQLSRYRELAADRAAAAATGSPAALASALRTLDGTERPRRDRRGATSAFAIVPEAPPEPVRLGPDGRRRRSFAGLRETVRRAFRTHPTLDRRLDALAEMQATAEAKGDG